jgi:PAS domain S-box-containing protein
VTATIGRVFTGVPVDGLVAVDGCRLGGAGEVATGTEPVGARTTLEDELVHPPSALVTSAAATVARTGRTARMAIPTSFSPRAGRTPRGSARLDLGLPDLCDVGDFIVFTYAIPRINQNHGAGDGTWAMVRQGDDADHDTFRAAFDDAPIGLIVSEVASPSQPSGRITMANPAMEAMLGYGSGELVGRSVNDITAPEDRWLVHDPTEANPRRVEKRYQRSDGAYVWVEVSSAYIRSPDGTPTAVIRHVEDITTRKQSEQALLDALETQRRAAEQLRQVERMRDELMRTVTHELRTPLTSIYGYIEMLLDEPLTERHRDMLEVALRNATRLSMLLDELHEQATERTTGTGSVNWRPEPIRFDRLIRAAVEAILPVTVRNGQRLLTPETIPDVIISGDHDQLHRALMNILTNATKYTGAAGVIDIDVGVQGTEAFVRIEDTGIGIPGDELPHLFERDYRASTALAQRIHGSGIGLAIAANIVEGHGGRIEVDSSLGIGSTFTMWLPIALP